MSNEELEEFQSSTIADLVYPRKTILDESLGSALWFAARAKDCDNSISPCRVSHVFVFICQKTFAQQAKSSILLILLSYVLDSIVRFRS